MKTAKMLALALVFVLSFALVSCNSTPQNSSQTPITLPASISGLPSNESVPSNVSPSTSSSTDVSGFLEKAYAMGYSDKQLEYLKNSEISEDRILDLSVSIDDGVFTPDGRYSLCKYEVDFVVSCWYLLNTETHKVSVLPDWQNGYAKFEFLDNELFYALSNDADYKTGIRLYHVENPYQAYATWNPADSTEENEKLQILLNIYKIDNAEMLLAFWCETPIEWGGLVEDDTEKYRITLINHDGDIVKEIDTDILLSSSKTGIAGPDFDKSNFDREQMPNIVYFDIGELSYQLNYQSGIVTEI